ncbi:acetylornithine deacetylase/succinyl-diaminopimelate desuccinylase-like protein [Arthrobacter sp. B2I5]|uniref:M20/M25/M40 family metallo-hydrolase n=1 Tax=Arthrobacter sp. B2I5 TaxID=3042266 RepID=UPI0027849D5D|nr:M20/M25/M40 family metallo-hydrolase [Arthrobacter sp. B2I5]MDQ0824711.1 acetylornithine deacetylase/succinyl-diaminopimelate desuccinylase-like protein [Arthrobacter sp. B2I5]
MAPPSKVDQDVLAGLRQAVRGDFRAAVGELSELVRIPAMAWDSFDPSQLDQAAQQVAGLLRNAGLADVDILQAHRPDGSPGAPPVVGRRPAEPGKPTILLYAHYDVQPAGALELWESPPFEAVERGGRLWGRGVADNKAGVLLHVAAVRNALRVLGSDLGVGITVFIDGEEEAGSPSLPLLQQHADLLRADVLVVADSGNWKVGVPALTTSLRGLVLGTIEVRVLEHALHSGTYGGPLVDAVAALSRLIASFHHDDGSVAVEGLPASEEPGPSLNEAEFRADSRVLPGVPLAGSGSLTSRLWTKPAMAIIGIDAPSVALSSDTLQPAARARFSLSLAPSSDTAAAMEAVRRHVEAHVPFGADVVFTPGGRTEGFAGDASSPASRSMLAAMSDVWGVPAVSMGVGGSIPAVNILNRLYPEAEILITGAEDPDSRAHGANESIHLGDFENAIVAEALLLARLNAG